MNVLHCSMRSRQKGERKSILVSCGPDTLGGELQWMESLSSVSLELLHRGRREPRNLVRGPSLASVAAKGTKAWQSPVGWGAWCFAFVFVFLPCREVRNPVLPAVKQKQMKRQHWIQLSSQTEIKDESHTRIIFLSTCMFVSYSCLYFAEDCFPAGGLNKAPSTWPSNVWIRKWGGKGNDCRAKKSAWLLNACGRKL